MNKFQIIDYLNKNPYLEYKKYLFLVRRNGLRILYLKNIFIVFNYY